MTLSWRVLFCLFLLFLDAGREACVLILLDPYLALDSLVEGYLRFGLLYIRNLLDGVKKYLHQVVVVEAVDLDQEVVLSGYEMTLHHL